MWKRLLLLNLFVMTMCGASPPKIKVVVPTDNVTYGDIIMAQAVIDKSTVSNDLVDYKYKWTVLDNGVKKQVMVWPDGTQIFFAAGMKDKTFTIILQISLLYESKEGDVIKSASLEIVDPIISVVTVGNTPTPVPDPVVPDPPLPPGQFGLSAFTRDTLKADTSIANADKVKLAAALSPSFNKVAAQISALATFKDVEKQILPAIKESNTAAIAASGVPVTSTVSFKAALSDKIYSLYHDTPQKLVSADDFANAFREIAIGLDAIK